MPSGPNPGASADVIEDCVKQPRDNGEGEFACCLNEL